MPGTRHSVGMAVVGQIARRLGVAESWARDSRCAADLALAPLGDAQLVLLRPRRLMNVNGRSVAQAAELFGLAAEEIYLVHDELDKPLGKLALKLGGSARQCQGCGWASGAPHTPIWWRLTSWDASPQKSRSYCPHCWIRPLTCSWTTSVLGASGSDHSGHDCLPARSLKPGKGHTTAMTHVVPTVYVTCLGCPGPLADSRKVCGHNSLFLR
ncbi:peptidyl-tRNA hydrolase isoform X3 [Meriones unguiculatus]|nr:peptidyl-tRNA hydrolase isoform X3 [Meriones unguiculatus]